MPSEETLWCLFSNISVVAHRVSESILSCLTPAISIKSVFHACFAVLSDFYFRSGFSHSVACSHQFIFFPLWEITQLDWLPDRSGFLLVTNITDYSFCDSGVWKCCLQACRLSGAVSLNLREVESSTWTCYVSDAGFQDITSIQLVRNSLVIANLKQKSQYVLPVVYFIIPSSSSDFGDVRVTVAGISFYNSKDILLCIGSSNFSASLITSTLIISSVRVKSPGNFSVSIRLDGHESASQGIFFESNVCRFKAFPSFGPYQGGTLLTIFGFKEMQNIGKAVNSFVIGPVPLSCNESTSGYILCSVPLFDSSFSVSSYFRNISESNISNGCLRNLHCMTSCVQFMFVSPIHVVSIHPSFGSIDGGSLITLSGDSDRLVAMSLFCKFDQSYSKIFQMKSTSSGYQMICTTPKQKRAGNSAVSISSPLDQILSNEVIFLFDYPASIISLVPSIINSGQPARLTILEFIS